MIDCVLWEGRRNRAGYGTWGPKLAHRVIYERAMNVTLDGHTCIHHICGQRLCVNVEHMLAMPLQHRHEHRIAALGALHQHRRDDGHHHPEEALPAHALANIGETDRRVGPERCVVGPQQLVAHRVLHTQIERELTSSTAPDAVGTVP